MDGSATSDDLPISGYAKRLETVLGKLNGRVKHSGKNAFDHVRKAWALRSIDPAMAAFRAITAEEEAATALIVALKQRQYPNADKINFRNHDHKASIGALISVLSTEVFSKIGHKPRVLLSENPNPLFARIQIDLNELMGISGQEPQFAEPQLPLDFTLGDRDGSIKDLASEFRDFAGERGHKAAKEFIKSEANLRNQILYATDSGIPRVAIKDDFILVRKDRVLTILTIAVMIAQTSDHQAFVLQCLGIILHRLEKIDEIAPQRQPLSDETARLYIEKNLNTFRTEIAKGEKKQTIVSGYTTETIFTLQWLPVWAVRYDGNKAAGREHKSN